MSHAVRLYRCLHDCVWSWKGNCCLPYRPPRIEVTRSKPWNLLVFHQYQFFKENFVHVGDKVANAPVAGLDEVTISGGFGKMRCKVKRRDKTIRVLRGTINLVAGPVFSASGNAADLPSFCTPMCTSDRNRDSRYRSTWMLQMNDRSERLKSELKCLPQSCAGTRCFKKNA